MIDEAQTPTHRRIGALLDEWFFAPPNDRGCLSLEDCNDLLDRLSQILSEECGHRVVFRDAARDLFKYGINEARELAGRDDHTRDMVEFMISNITMGAACLIKEVVCAEIDEEKAKLANLPQYKAQDARVRAVQIARELWPEGTEGEPRVGKGAEEIRDKLSKEGFSTKRGPYAKETVKSWILRARVVPQSARRPGR